jgi:hypothetical protein
MAKRILFSLILLGAVAGAPAQAAACASYGHALAAMVEAHEAVRARVDYLAPPEDRLATRHAGQVGLVERTNVQRFASLLAECGWPRRSVDGEQALVHAHKLATQASGNLSLHKMVLRQLEPAVAAGEAPGRDLALVADRVAVMEKRPQPYGTQLRLVGQCTWDFHPLDERSLVEERRKAVGLPPLEDAKRAANAMVIQENCSVPGVAAQGQAG